MIANHEAELKIEVEKIQNCVEPKETIEKLHDREPMVFVGSCVWNCR